MIAANVPIDSDPLWYKDAILYEVHVRAFCDSDGDGMGDFRGLTQKLDYLQDLGVTAIWLLPFSPSPWRDDGYDISDYTGVHPAYGTLRDFQNCLREAHRRGIRVITEVVVNHTSDQHPWFQRSRRAAPGTRWRDFYVWSDDPKRYGDARIIFKDFETSNWTWDPVANAYYWHRFYSHQPDLNFDSPHVREAVLGVADFWLGMGVDGFRLDAVPYLYEREGTNCENLPETHAFLREVRSRMDAKYPGRMILAEANQWPDDAIAYFGNGDECHMAFHFPLMPRLFMAIRMEDRFPILEILEQTPPIPENCQWALFLRNHDELTLEMVTDEERDYMYRVYAHDQQMRLNLGIRRRLAPLLGNDRKRIELMTALLFALPGTPVLYYGDEIGMGDNIYLGDRNGVRTPMQWSADRNAGFSRANPQKLFLPVTIDPEYHYEAINVEAQHNNPHSLFWWTKRLIEHRKRFRAFGRGSLEFLDPSNRKVLAFYRCIDQECILMIANLSRFTQYVELNLSRFKGFTPVEIFGRSDFPAIGENPYIITLGPHSFYWFSLEQRAVSPEPESLTPAADGVPLIEIVDWANPLRPRVLQEIVRLLPAFLKTRRWYLGKSRTILTIRVLDLIPIPETSSYICLVQIAYGDGDPDVYMLPGSVAQGDEATTIEQQHPEVIFARLRSPDGRMGVLYTAVANPIFSEVLLGAIARRRRFRGQSGEIIGSHNRMFRPVWGPGHPRLQPSGQVFEQRNNSIVFGDRFFLKLYRRLEPGVHPEFEMLDFLTAKEFPHAPPITGHLEYRPANGPAMTLGILEGYAQNQGNAWRYTLDSIGRFFELAQTRNIEESAHPAGHILAHVHQSTPPGAHDLLGEYGSSVRILGWRLAELHVAIADAKESPQFAPEPWSDHYRQSLFHSLTSRATRCFQQLRARMAGLPEDVQADARKLIEQDARVRSMFRQVRDRRIVAQRIRIHGEMGLRHILYTGKDFVITDFEGDPGARFGERRIKRSPLFDVACLIQSFQYAARAGLLGTIPGLTPRPETLPVIEHWSGFWYSWVGALFLKGYLEIAEQAKFLPAGEDDVRRLLDVYLIEKAFSDIRAELADRPEWVSIPIRSALQVLEQNQE